MAMTRRQNYLARARGEAIDRLPFAPDLSVWHRVNEANGTMPERYRGMSLPELHDDLDCCMPWHIYGDFMEFEYPGMELETSDDGDRQVTALKTPVGEVTGYRQRVPGGESFAWREHWIKTVDDIKVVEYMLENRVVRPRYDRLAEVMAWIGDRGIGDMVVGYTPLLRVLVEWAGIEHGIYMLYDHPDEMRHLMEVAAAAEDPVFEIVANAPGCEIVIIGDNMDTRYVSPNMYEEFCLPQYQRRTEFLHSHGKIVSTHMDGSIKALFPYLKDTGFDYIDGCTPAPMNDYTPPELRAALGENQRAQCGPPSTLFPMGVPDDEIESSAREVIDGMGDKLLMIVGDQVPENSHIEQVRLVARIAAEAAV